MGSLRPARPEEPPLNGLVDGSNIAPVPTGTFGARSKKRAHTDGAKARAKPKTAGGNNGLYTGFGPEVDFPYQEAVMTLGLFGPFTQQDLRARFKALMKRAHSNTGGNNVQAIALNSASQQRSHSIHAVNLAAQETPTV